MKVFLTIAIVGLTLTAHAETTYVVSGKQATKVEALTALIKDHQADVVKCSPQELTDKATMKNKKQTKLN